MAASEAIAGFGSLLKRGDGAVAEAFTAIAECTNISGPALTQETAEVTHHESPGGFGEHIGTILRAGEVTLDLNFIPTSVTQKALRSDLVAKTLRNLQLVFPDPGNTTWSFSALVTSFEVTEPVDDKLGASCTLMISGEPTLN